MSQFAAPQVVRLFSEARLHRSSDGTVRAVDVTGASVAWANYADKLEAAEIAARVGPPNPAAGLDVGQIAVHPLPFYTGPRQFLARLPWILTAVIAATSGATYCIFRLPGAMSLIGAIWCRLRGRPYAVEVVGDPVGVLKSNVLGVVGRVIAPICGHMMRWVVGGAEAGRYVTEATLQSAYPLGSNVSEHAYSNVSLDSDDFTPAPRTADRRVGRLIAVGTHDQLYKGHDDLIRAVAALRSRGVDVHLGLVGDGRHHHELRRLACDLKIEQHVTFYGRIHARTQLRRLLDEADLFCMPSRTEGLPRALIEAMARGVPSIGTTAGGIPELLDPALCVPPGDVEALAALIASFANGDIDSIAVSDKVWHRAERFGPEQQAERAGKWLNEIALLARGVA